MSELQLKDLATREGYDQSLLDDIVTEANYYRDLDQQQGQLKALMGQYKLCRISEDDLREDAEKLGIPSEVVDYQMSIASWGTSCGTRRETAANLCTALDQGMITASEYVTRMKVLKYDDVAIERLLGLCQNKIKARVAKQALKDQQDAAKAEEQAQKRAEQEAEKAQRNMQKAANNAAKVERGRQSRNKMLEDATARLSKALGQPYDVAHQTILMAYDGVMTQYGLSQNEAAAACSLAAAQWKGTDAADYLSMVDSVAKSALIAPWELFPVL